MKKRYTTFLFLIVTIYNSQTLTQSFNEPVVGEVDKSYRVDTSAYASGMPITLTGTNCIWDFTKLSGAFPVVVDSFITPSAAPNFTAYPGASFVQNRDLLHTFFKSTASPSQTELLGATSPSLTLTFTNSAIIATYPVSFGYNLSDPVSGTFKYNTANGAVNGNINISVPGTGTINFSGGISIPNVLCLKSVEILTLSAGVFPFGTFNQTIYNFYMPGKKFPILNINYSTYKLISGTPTITAFVYGSNNYFTVAGLNENNVIQDEMIIYPNPFTEKLYIINKNTIHNEYFFYDMNGRLLFSSTSLDDDKVLQMNSGLYFLTIRNKSGTRHRKLLKE